MQTRNIRLFVLFLKDIVENLNLVLYSEVYQSRLKQHTDYNPKVETTENIFNLI